MPKSSPWQKNYDIMNDVMSGGLHRVWKTFHHQYRPPGKGDKVLISPAVQAIYSRLGETWAKKAKLADRHQLLHADGCRPSLNEGMIRPHALADAEKLPFPDNYFNLVSSHSVCAT